MNCVSRGMSSFPPASTVTFRPAALPAATVAAVVCAGGAAEGAQSTETILLPARLEALNAGPGAVKVGTPVNLSRLACRLALELLAAVVADPDPDVVAVVADELELPHAAASNNTAERGPATKSLRPTCFLLGTLVLLVCGEVPTSQSELTRPIFETLRFRGRNFISFPPSWRFPVFFRLPNSIDHAGESNSAEFGRTSH